MAGHYGRHVARSRGDVGNLHTHYITIRIGSGEITTDHGYIIRTGYVRRAGDAGWMVDQSHIE